MITPDFIILLFLAIVCEVFAVFSLIYGIYAAITDKAFEFCFGMAIYFLFVSFLSGLVFRGAYEEYQNAIPQNQVKILRQRIFDAEKEYQKYLIDHPELKEIE